MWRPDKQTPSRFTEETPASSAASATPVGAVTQTAPPSPGDGLSVAEEPSIGERIAAELDAVNRRERELREIQDLALRRVAELRGDQLRRLLEFVD